MRNRSNSSSSGAAMVDSIGSTSISRALPLEEISPFIMQRYCLVRIQAGNTDGLLCGHIGSIHRGSSNCLVGTDSCLLLVIQLQSRQLIDMVDAIDIRSNSSIRSRSRSSYSVSSAEKRRRRWRRRIGDMTIVM